MGHAVCLSSASERARTLTTVTTSGQYGLGIMRASGVFNLPARMEHLLRQVPILLHRHEAWTRGHILIVYSRQEIGGRDEKLQMSSSVQ